jgi:hypothetical protein
VNTCPFIPIDNNDENSAYATLLLHTPWSCNGENALIVGYDTAVAKLSAQCDASELRNDKSDSITMTQSTARKVGEKFKGTKLLVLDEISMINLKSIAEISLRHQKGLHQ